MCLAISRHKINVMFSKASLTSIQRKSCARFESATHSGGTSGLFVSSVALQRTTCLVYYSSLELDHPLSSAPSMLDLLLYSPCSHLESLQSWQSHTSAPCKSQLVAWRLARTKTVSPVTCLDGREAPDAVRSLRVWRCWRAASCRQNVAHVPLPGSHWAEAQARRHSLSADRCVDLRCYADLTQVTGYRWRRTAPARGLSRLPGTGHVMYLTESPVPWRHCRLHALAPGKTRRGLEPAA